MKILIIRHAEPDYALDSLTEKGFREARLLGEYLHRHYPEISSFYVSLLEERKRLLRPLKPIIRILLLNTVLG